MNTPIVTQSMPKNQALAPPTWAGWGQRNLNSRYGAKNQTCNPGHRLVAAIALQAIKDLVQPEQNPRLTLLEYHTALLFITNHADLYLSLGIPQTKLDELLAWASSREEVAAWAP